VYPVAAPARGTPMASYATNGADYMLTRESMEWFWDHYLADESDGRDGYASPLLADDHTGLPPALVITAEFDPLRDEGRALAAALGEAGVPVELLDYDGAIHGFLVMSGRMDHGHRAVLDIAHRLRADHPRSPAAAPQDP
jgi:acetyl esterase